MTERFATHTFTLAELHAFAHHSGDWNPIHVDPVAARRLVAGEVVVHGMAGLLWALDAHFRAANESPARITATFRRPLVPEIAIQAYRTTEGGATRLSLRQQGEEGTSVLLRGISSSINEPLPDTVPPRATPMSNGFAELKDRAGTLDVSGEAAALQRTYPDAVATLGLLPVASIMTLSRLVGMECPGLHSLYSGLDVTLGPARVEPRLKWRVSRHSAPIAPIRITVAGAGIDATVDAFVRPKPAAQPDMSDVAKAIAPAECHGQRAVVIGGSRGLGEIVAKLVSAGGGEALFTYRSGAEDAARVVREITVWGGKATALQADTAQKNVLAETLVRLAPTHLYYFATPHIAARQGVTRDDVLAASYIRIYADDFEDLMTSIVPRLAHPLKVFYPSTTFIDERPRHFTEYIEAKLEGEGRCRQLLGRFANLNIVMARLPRMHTDQTASLIPVSVCDGLEEMARVVRQMSSSISDQGTLPHGR